MPCACRRPGGLELTRRGLELCAFAPRAIIADIGCGAGASVRLALNAGLFAVGLDPRAEGGRLPLLRARAEALPFAPGSLHGIICECVLSILADAAGALRGFAEACGPGAWLLLTDVYIKTQIGAGSDPTPGIMSRPDLEAALLRAGWEPRHFEDHSPALKEFAARMLWYSAGPSLALEPQGLSRDAPWQKALPAVSAPRSAYGYGLWTARKG